MGVGGWVRMRACMHMCVYLHVCVCTYVALFHGCFYSDGMSRSGVFITCLSEIERVKVEGGVNIFQTVKTARAQRPHMVHTSVSYCLQPVNVTLMPTEMFSFTYQFCE